MDIFTENYCRFCLKEKSRRVKLSNIDKEIEETFNELTQIKLSNTTIFSSLSTSICDGCRNDLNKCIKIKRLFTEKQAELEKLAIAGCSELDVKTEVLNDTEILDNSNIKIESDNESRDNEDFEFAPSFVDFNDNNDDYEEEIKTNIEEIDVQNEQSKTVSDKRKQCTQCGSIVKNLVEHMKYTHHQVEKKYFCDKCKFSCYFKHKMEIHVTKHIPREFRNMIECPECLLKFERKDTLKKHIEALHRTNREKNHKCEECNKSYYCVSQLNTHIKTHHRNIRNFACQHCGKKFYSVKDLNLHVPRHFEKKEKCPNCDLMFFTQAEVRSHIKRIHLPPTIKCDHPGCERMFATNEKYKIHKKIRHERRKDFVCAECGAAFAQYNTLSRHNDTVHRSLRVICPLENCGFSMKRKERFKNHLIKYHPHLDDEAMEKVIKSLKYETEEQKQHVKEFICPDCGKIFTKYHNLKNHIKKGHEKKIYPPKIFRCPLENCTYKGQRKYRFKTHLIKVHQQIDEETRESILKDVKYEEVIDG